MYITVIVSSPTREYLEELSRDLIGENLAACIQISGPIRSFYSWKGELESAEEWKAEIKSMGTCFAKIREKILESHPYEVPEILSFNVSDGHASYLKWIEESCKANKAI